MKDTQVKKRTFAELYGRYGIGMRIIKTAIAVFICLITADLLGQEPPFYACIAAVFAMQDTVQSSLKIGVNRLIGTAVGGAVAIVLILAAAPITSSLLYHACIALAIILSLYLCSLLKRTGAAATSCVVLLSIVIIHADGSVPFAFWRMGETAYGIVVSLVVNRTVNLPGRQTAPGKEPEAANPPQMTD